MKRIKYTSFDSFVLRTPLFPLKKMYEVLNGDCVSEDRLKKICKDIVFQEALYIASPSFFKEFIKWLEGELTNPKDSNKIFKSVLRYFTRMCTRCTPFGLFAGISVGKIDRIDSKDGMMSYLFSSINSYIRLDMYYIFALASDLSKNNILKDILLFYPNNSIYFIGNQINYIEYYYSGLNRSYHISAVDADENLVMILEKAKEGKCVFDLAQLLISEDVSMDDALSYLYELIDSQILKSELEPTVVGVDPLKQMLFILDKYSYKPEVKSIIEKLSAVDVSLSNMNGKVIGHSIEEFKAVKQQLSLFHTKYDERFLFQEDMFKHVKDCTIPKEFTEEVINVVGLLFSLRPAIEHKNLEKFKEAYIERYGDEELPLSQVIDSEYGIGYLQGVYSGVTPLVDDLVFPPPTSNYYSVNLSLFDILMQSKLQVAIQNAENVIRLYDDDLKNYSLNYDTLPATLSVLIQRVSDREFYVKSAGGSCAANLIGRFCHLDEGLLNHVKEIIAKDETVETEDGCIYAEIVHLPDSRVGNVLHRPHFRNYEIPYLTSSTSCSENQISINDLYVSVRNNRIVLRSKKNNKEVIPRLTTAHNYSFKSLPIYHFLCDLQTQEKNAGSFFSWGPYQNRISYLPRVVYGNAILSVQTWHFFGEDVVKLNNEKDISKRVVLFQKMVTTKRIPDEVLLEQGDNELYVNVQNKLSVEIMLNLVKKQSFFTLKEFLMTKKAYEKNEYANEVLISYYKQN